MDKGKLEDFKEQLDNNVQNQLHIFNHYGEEKQFDQLIEECAELIVAITKLKRYGNSDISVAHYYYHFVSEMADVLNIIEQFMISNPITCQKVEKIKTEKIDRQIQRIKEEG